MNIFWSCCCYLFPVTTWQMGLGIFFWARSLFVRRLYPVLRGIHSLGGIILASPALWQLVFSIFSRYLLKSLNSSHVGRNTWMHATSCKSNITHYQYGVKNNVHFCVNEISRNTTLQILSPEPCTVHRHLNFPTLWLSPCWTRRSSSCGPPVCRRAEPAWWDERRSQLGVERLTVRPQCTRSSLSRHYHSPGTVSFTERSASPERWC